MIATGITESGLTDDVELINLDESNPGSSCKKLSNFPIPVASAGAAGVGGNPVVCGGLTANGSSSCSCHQLERGTWRQFLHQGKDFRRLGLRGL